MRKIIRNIYYYYYPNFVENFLMIRKCREKIEVPSPSSNDTVNVHLTFHLKTLEDSFLGKLLLLPLLRKMQNPSDWRVPKCSRTGCEGWYCKSSDHSHDIQVNIRTFAEYPS
ncbi:unnamed protein product [Litomosoides sigmodontis]|uniref:Uncharacterized protein n=1 Tax=Litomosoides sigmodontis TaxID=42156 RepID=A0A3P7K1Z3_LITSI|nr:unnamed protein product [Litomosoides sigmodontis]